MLTSLALIFLAGLLTASVCQLVRLPRIIGMLATGILLGPCVLNVLDSSILNISAELRKMALVIILIKAGLSLNIRDLKQVGRPALLMSFLPALFEVAAFVLFAPLIFGISRIEAAVLGAVLGSVSPAVVVPKMVQLIETRCGTGKSIPQLILAGASLDDVFVIVLFTTFTGIAQGGGSSLSGFAGIPVSVVLGILAGTLTGYFMAYFFEACYRKKHYIRNSTKVIIVLGTSLILTALETFLEPFVPFSGLLAVMAMACVLQTKTVPSVSMRLSQKFGKLWIAAEVILFVLVGAAVDIRYTLKAGPGAILLIFLALLLRSAGVLICFLGTNLNQKERLFCVISYLPKATVQAAIGSVPLALGLPCGKLVLSTAVLAILITAPLGAFGMDATGKRFLQQEDGPHKLKKPESAVTET